MNWRMWSFDFAQDKNDGKCGFGSAPVRGKLRRINILWLEIKKSEFQKRLPPELGKPDPFSSP